jgi:hypothetical protein
MVSVEGTAAERAAVDVGAREGFIDELLVVIRPCCELGKDSAQRTALPPSQ